MSTEMGAMKTKVHYSKDKQHRYLTTKEWDTSLLKATIIMINNEMKYY